jgi:hypothetical protein
MNSNTYPHLITTSWDEPTGTNTATVELLSFDIGPACFGLPISTVDRIVDLNKIDNDFSSLLTGAEILDLHHRLLGMSLSDPPIWIIVKSLNGRSNRIPTDILPTLIYVPLDRIRILPDDFRATSPLGIASHVAMVTTPQGGELIVLIIIF